MVYRIYVEKKKDLAKEAADLLHEARTMTRCSGVMVWISARPGLWPRPARPTTWVSILKVVSAAR